MLLQRKDMRRWWGQLVLALALTGAPAALAKAPKARAAAPSKVKAEAPKGPAAKPKSVESSPAPKAAAPAKADPKADQAYADAKADYQKLKADPQRRKFRHHWLNAAKRFEQIARVYEKSERAAEALYTAGGLYDELSRLSAQSEDQAAAKSAYERLISGWPAHRLADDAAYALARLLLDRDGAPAQARAVLEAALARSPVGDRQAELAKLLGALPPP
ncbi:MAG: hypothetical protein K1X89_29735, partial [Myxococcaceae bacterium]|nr:hypothetical protein [Myxococcaceae bacterium]